MVGRSIREIVWARLRRDKVAMVCLGILTFYVVMAIIGPNLLSALGWDPYTFDRNAIDPAKGGLPRLPLGGIRAPPPPGVAAGAGAAAPGGRWEESAPSIPSASSRDRGATSWPSS